MAPPYFNIAEKKKVEVNATCGQDDIRGDTDETYCKLVGYDQKSYDSFSVSMGMNVVDGQVRTKLQFQKLRLTGFGLRFWFSVTIRKVMIRFRFRWE